MASDSSGDVVGVVIIARHGDRRGYYQSPDTYTASDTTITPLGEQEEWQLGALLRSIYLNESSSSYIQGIAPLTSAFNFSQVQVYADNSGEGSVIMDSAAALVQGLWQPTDLQNTTLANGSTIISPLGGYQYVPINSVDPDGDITVDGTTDCTAFNTHTTTVYNSSIFQAKAEAASSFFSELSPYVGGRSLQLSNMWNIFDYMNVQSIHNATFANALPDGFLAQARALVNWQQYQVFTDPSFDGIGNMGFRTMLPGILDSFDQFQNASTGLKLSYYAISYKPFLGLFNMTGIVNDGQVLEAIVDYAGSTVFELRQPSNSSEPTVRLMFKNGTSATDYSPVTMNFTGWNGAEQGTDVPLSTFVSAFAPAAVNSTTEWCQICGTTTERGCAEALAAASETAGAGSGGHARISRVGAGFLGAGLTAAVFLMAFGVLAFLGVLTVGGRRWRKRAVSLSKENNRSQGGDVETHSEANSLSKAHA